MLKRFFRRIFALVVGTCPNCRNSMWRAKGGLAKNTILCKCTNCGWTGDFLECF